MFLKPYLKLNIAQLFNGQILLEALYAHYFKKENIYKKIYCIEYNDVKCVTKYECE